MDRDVIDAQREIFTEARDEALVELARLRASSEEFSKGGVDQKPAEIALQERIAAEYDSLLRALPA
jgi:hypothetical protein